MSTHSDQSRGLLREVARMYTRAQRVVADCCRTTNTQCHLLTELAHSGPLPLSELGTRVSLEKSWVSRAVEAMVERGLVAVPARLVQASSPWLFGLCLDQWGAGALWVSGAVGLLAFGALFAMPKPPGELAPSSSPAAHSTSS